MFVELTEFLRCPLQHEGKTYCVLVPQRMEGRDVVAGMVACPECRREFPILAGVADLRHPDDAEAVPDPDVAGPTPPAEAVHALLGLEGPGGYVVLVGSAARMVTDLATLLEGVQLVLVNAPSGRPESTGSSVLLGGRLLPLRTSMARGVVVGGEHARAPWLAEGARVLLRGLRLVVLAERVEVAGVEPLAAGQGMWVGQRT